MSPSTVSFLTALRAHPDATLHVVLPDDDVVPPHFHVTEVGRVQKDFVDCGGTRRSSTHCQLQLLVAGDTDHRLTAGKLAKIVALSAPVLGDDALPLVFEYEDCRTIAFPVRELHATAEQITVRLALPQTQCLAADACGLSAEEANAGCGCAPSETGTGCC